MPRLRGLPDYLAPKLRLVIVGVNPSIPAARQGHYYANPRNPFWRLLYESGLVSEALGPEDDVRILDFGIGLTDLVPRPTRGVSQLPTTYRRSGVPVLRRKLEACRPRVVCFNGKMVYNTYFGEVTELGLQDELIAGAQLFVIPSTSPAAAAWTYAEKLRYFRRLKRVVAKEVARDG